jgi:hypothetical protein
MLSENDACMPLRSLSSTTVAIMLLIIQPMLPDVCSGNTWPGFDANGAIATMPGGGAPSAPPRGPCATIAAEFRARSAGYEAAAGLEHRQTAVLLAGRQTFF